MPLKVAMVSLGCAKNMVNSEQMLYKLKEAGFDITSPIEDAEAVIINTCGFIESAKSEAIENILEFAEQKNSGKLKKIIVAGCLTERYKEEIFKELPEVDGILGCGSFDEIAEVLNEVLKGETVSRFGDIDSAVSETNRIVTSGAGWAYLRIAEGCDNRCSYCVIPSLRGKYRSRPMENVLQEAKDLVDSGAKELIIIAQDITRFGTDLYGERKLSELIKNICRIEGLKWLRLHYLYPDEIDDILIEVIASEDKVLKYLDIPIQHISDSILSLMNRRGTSAEIRALFKKLRERIPGLVIRTSIITGLPSEGEDEFEELAEFLRIEKIERAGIFAYSPEEGTTAAEMPDRPDRETAEHRAELLVNLQSEIIDEFNKSRVGREFEVLVEGYDSEAGLMYGRSYADSPDVDGKVFLVGEAEPGSFVKVIIIGLIDGDVYGEVIV
jgi:ribosomal protein S12 methylthiotransferase